MVRKHLRDEHMIKKSKGQTFRGEFYSINERGEKREYKVMNKK